MKLKILGLKGSGRPFFAFLFLSMVFTLALISSCQKDSVEPPNTSSQTTSLSKNFSFSHASNASITYKTSAPLTYTGVNNLTISGLSITAGTVPAISLKNCTNVHIVNSRLVNGTVVGAVGVWLMNCSNVTIDSCYFNNLPSGVLASTSTGINVTSNQMLNMTGPLPRGQFVQFVSCYGAGNKITSNKLQNVMGSSNPEDAISVYESNGTSASPILVSGNWIMGGGPSKTGGGINLGDGGGSYEEATSNILVNPGQYGVAVSAGTNMQILNNEIYGAKNTFTNVGTFAWNQYTSTSGCSIITISGNLVNFTAAGGYQNSDWNGGNCGTIAGWSTNTWGDAKITPSILPATIITMH